MIARLWLLSLLLLCSCASTLGRGPFLLNVDSVPQGASVHYENVEVGKTPCSIWVRGNNQDLAIRLADHHEQLVVLGGIPNEGLMVLGFVFLGPIELIVDEITGSCQHVNYAPVKVEMTPLDRPKPPVWERPTAP